MNNLSGHTASFFGGSALAAAVLGILTGQFHIDANLASNWLIVGAALLGGPVLAYLSVKAKSDPALAAALAAITAMQQTNGNGAVSTTSQQTVVTNPPAAAPAPAPAPALPPPAAAPAAPPLVGPAGAPLAASNA